MKVKPLLKSPRQFWVFLEHCDYWSVGRVIQRKGALTINIVRAIRSPGLKPPLSELIIARWFEWRV